MNGDVIDRALELCRRYPTAENQRLALDLLRHDRAKDREILALRQLLRGARPVLAEDVNRLRRDGLESTAARREAAITEIEKALERTAPLADAGSEPTACESAGCSMCAGGSSATTEAP